MPASFRLPLDYRAERPTEVWLPLVVDPANLGPWGSRSYFGIGRLADSVQPATATREFKVISDGWIRAGFVADNGNGRLARAAVPVDELITGEARRPLLILLGAVGVVLLVACANIVNLLLAKADVRRREVAVRAALGATRGRIVRQLLTESVVLSACGGLLGLGMAHAGVRILTTMPSVSVPRLEETAVDAGVLTFAAAVSLLTGLLSGLAPAFQLSRPEVSRVLQDGGRSGTPGRARAALRRGLVILQLASSVVLVIGAGLLVRSLVHLYRVDLGFDPRNVLTAQIQLPPSDYPESSDVVSFYRRLIERLEQAPGVVAAGAVRVLPLARMIGNWSITIEGRPYSREENPNADFQWVAPRYFEAMGTTLLRGRLLTSADREDGPLVVVINETMAARYWPNEDALGKRFQMGGGGKQPKLTIVGIVRTARHNKVVELPRAEMYLPHAQLPRSVGGAARAMALVLKSSVAPPQVAAPLREAVREMDRTLPVADVRTMEQITAAALSGPRFATLLLGLFATLALTLASVGIYGTISLLAAERTHEIGIRLALGAERRAILALILRHGLVLAGAGVALGVAGALVLTRLMRTLVYDVSTMDPLTFAAVPVLLGGVALIACIVPARRAAAVDPAITLRQT